jgi:hypothetical protein
MLATVLGVLFLLACPQSIGLAFTVLAWLLTNPAGAVILGVAFATSLLAAYRGCFGWRTTW